MINRRLLSSMLVRACVEFRQLAANLQQINQLGKRACLSLSWSAPLQCNQWHSVRSRMAVATNIAETKHVTPVSCLKQ